MSNKLWRMYKMAPPVGEPFYLAIDREMSMLTTRVGGKWGADKVFDNKTLSVADVLNPIYKLGDWDVVRVDPAEAPSL